MIALPVGENRMIVASFVSTQYQRVTEDRQTDGRTDTLVSNTAVGIASAVKTASILDINDLLTIFDHIR